MKNKKYYVTALALLLVAGISVKPAMAYFTATTEAKGTVQIKIGDSELKPTDEGEVTDATHMTKKVKVANTSGYDCYIRIKAIAGSNYTVEMASGNWTKDGDYYVFNEIVKAGEETTEISFNITVSEIKDQTFNVIIVEEATKVHYNAEGEPFAKWGEKIAEKTELAEGQTTTQTTTQLTPSSETADTTEATEEQEVAE